MDPASPGADLRRQMVDDRFRCHRGRARRLPLAGSASGKIPGRVELDGFEPSATEESRLGRESGQRFQARHCHIGKSLRCRTLP